MPTTTGKSLEELKAMRAEMMAQGKTLSTSKSLGKVEDAIKVLQPEKYGEETVAAAKLKLASSTQVPTTEGISGTSLGLTGGGVPASIDLNKMYESAINAPEITTLEQEITSKKAALTTAMTNINDNPYYSEATRTGHLAKLQLTANAEISDLNDQLVQKKADVQTKLNIAMKQYDINNQEYQNNIQRLNLLISSGALLNASGTDIASIALATGMSTSMVKGIQTKMKSELVKPQVITDTNDAGVSTVSIIDANTGKLISQTSLGATGKVTRPKEATTKEVISALDSAMFTVVGGDQKISPENYIAERNYAAGLGVSAASFDQQFGIKYVNPKDYTYYQIVDQPTKDALDAIKRGR